jgi:hypothetical protein
MRRIRIVGLVLTTAFVLSMIAVSSASADEVLCLQVAEAGGGNYATNQCNGARGAGGEFVRGMLSPLDRVAPGSEEYCLRVLPGQRNFAKGYLTLTKCKNAEVLEEEGAVESGLPLWTRVKDPAAGNKGGSSKREFKELPSGKKIEGFSGATLFRASTGESVECEGGTNGGEITSMDTVGNVVVKYTGCKARGSSSCTAKSTGAKEGEIITGTLKGLLGAVKSTEAATEVGVLLEPASGTQFTSLEGTCLAVSPTAIDGTVAGELNPVNAKVLDGDLDFETTTAKQNIKEIDVLSGTVKPKLDAFGLIEATDESFDELEFEGFVEVA